MTDTDHRFMHQAIELAHQNSRHPFAALLVDLEQDTIISTGLNQSSHSKLLHGEVDALLKLAELDPPPDASKLTLYTTAEPCPMCMAAALWAGVGRICYGTSIQTLTTLGWNQIDLSAHALLDRCDFRSMVLSGGVLEQECDALFITAAKHQAV